MGIGQSKSNHSQIPSLNSEHHPPPSIEPDLRENEVEEEEEEEEGEEKKMASSSSCPPADVAGVFQELERQYATIKAKIEEADRTKIDLNVDKHHLKELREILFDAEDVLLDAEYLKLQAKISPPKRKRQDQESWDNVVAKVRLILDRYKKEEKLLKALSYGFSDYRRARPKSTKDPLPRTSSLLREKHIYNTREEQKNEIIAEILELDASSPSSWGDDSNITILPIIGEEGLGKTTLAQHVYNDQWVRNHFEKMGWVCMTGRASVTDCLKALVESVALEVCKFDQLSMVHGKVDQHLRGKKFLLVLDDAQSLDYMGFWPYFWIPLRSAKKGSVVMVTTRDSRVVKNMPFDIPQRNAYCLEGLPLEDCWSLFKLIAFRSRDSDSHSILGETGEAFLKELQGNPSLVKKAAQRLPFRNSEELGSYLSTTTWNDVQINLQDVLSSYDQETKAREGRKREEELPQSGSLLDRQDIYSMKRNKEEIITFLMSDASTREEYIVGSYQKAENRNVTIFPIIGTAGLGKTTLARHVYHDSMVKEHFKKRGWVCMCGKNDIQSIKAVIECVSLQKGCNKLSELVSVQVALKEGLEEKRLLLVLDDARQEDMEFWSTFWASFDSVLEGSVIMITTRNYEVMKSMPPHIPQIDPYLLSPLKSEDCWSLFKSIAFPNRGSEESELHSISEETCRSFIKEFEGLPLLVKKAAQELNIKGSGRNKSSYPLFKEIWEVLRSSTDPHSSDIWKALQSSADLDFKDLLDTLRSSYRELSGPVKRCFLYCSLFPKGHKFDKGHLIKLWIAEGFVQSNGRRKLEDLGQEYFTELIHRSFLWYPQDGAHDGATKITMPSAVHYLAQSISGPSHSRIQTNNDWKQLQDIRHSSYVVRNCKEAMQFQPVNPTILRTFLIVRNTTCISRIQTFDDVLKSMQYLRTLDLSYTDIKELPGSVSYLQHLRYLGLNGTQITKLPDSICNLYNLQTIELKSCNNLHSLPKGLGKLINLRHLDLDVNNTSLFLPVGIGNLTRLQTLPIFNVSKENDGYSSMKELQEMEYLGGELRICGLSNVTKDSKLASLEKKKFLEKLTLSWSSRMAISTDREWSNDGCQRNSNIEKDENKENPEMVLENLKPHTNLTDLTIQNYDGVKFSDWIVHDSFKKLKYVKLEKCMKCDVLPPLGQVPSLKFVAIDRLPVKHITSKFCRRVDQAKATAPILKKLSFTDMSKWEDWQEDSPVLLQDLEIINCPALKFLPQIASLIELTIKYCVTLTILPEFNKLENLELDNCGGVISFPTLPNLKSLQLCECDALTKLPTLPALVSLSVKYCKLIDFFPGCLPEIHQFTLSNCPNVREVPQSGSIEVLGLENCNKITKLPDLSNLKDLQLYACDGLTKLPKLTSLNKLTLMYCDGLEGLPTLPPNTKRWIEDCKHLENALCSDMGKDSTSIGS